MIREETVAALRLLMARHQASVWGALAAAAAALTAPPVCRCATCGREFAYVAGFTPTTTRCYLCGPEAQGAAGRAAWDVDESQPDALACDATAGKRGDEAAPRGAVGSSAAFSSAGQSGANAR